MKSHSVNGKLYRHVLASISIIVLMTILESPPAKGQEKPSSTSASSSQIFDVDYPAENQFISVEEPARLEGHLMVTGGAVTVSAGESVQQCPFVADFKWSCFASDSRYPAGEHTFVITAWHVPQALDPITRHFTVVSRTALPSPKECGRGYVVQIATNDNAPKYRGRASTTWGVYLGNKKTWTGSSPKLYIADGDALTNDQTYRQVLEAQANGLMVATMDANGFGIPCAAVDIGNSSSGIRFNGILTWVPGD